VLRTALLAAIKRTEDGELRALSPLAGRSVLGWQTDLARQLGCERIICLCQAPGPEILALQQETEALGGEFHAVRGNAQLATLLRADDELLVMLDGLIVDRDLADELISRGDRWSRAVFTCKPDDDLGENLPDDFERIDAERIWAGLLVMRADSAQRLIELPADSDAISLLLRIALQTGVRGADIPESALTDGSILLGSSSRELIARQRVLIERSALPLLWSGPTRALAILTGRQLEYAGIKHGIELSGAIGIGLLAIGALLAWMGFGAGGLALTALGVFAGSVAKLLFCLKHRLFHRDSVGFPIAALRGFLEVLPVIAVIGAIVPSLNRIELIALPILTFGLVKIAASEGFPHAKAFWSDRTAQLAVLAVAAGVGFLVEALATIGLAALGHKLLRLRRK